MPAHSQRDPCHGSAPAMASLVAEGAPLTALTPSPIVLAARSRPPLRALRVLCQIRATHGFRGYGAGLLFARTAMIYELWESRSNNLVATFDTEREALSTLKKIVLAQGEDAVVTLELLWDDEERDEYGIVAVGQDLVERAKAAD